MSGRISAERLAELIDFASWPQLHESVTPEVASALDELQQSRALVTELRALAEEMNGYTHLSAEYWAKKIDSLLAAHDAQQAEGKEVEILWCVHVIGPDEVIAAPSEKAAKERAVALNAISAGLIDRPMFSFAAQPWPHGSDSHARSLIEDWPGLLSRGNEASKNSVGSAQAEGKGE